MQPRKEQRDSLSRLAATHLHDIVAFTAERIASGRGLATRIASAIIQLGCSGVRGVILRSWAAEGPLWVYPKMYL